MDDHIKGSTIVIYDSRVVLLETFQSVMGGRHSSVDLSAPNILRPRVRNFPSVIDDR